MKKIISPLLCLLLWGMSPAKPKPLLPGKTIRVIVGTPPGNLYDCGPASSSPTWESIFRAIPSSLFRICPVPATWSRPTIFIRWLNLTV